MTNSPEELPEDFPETPDVMPPEYYLNSAIQETEQAVKLIDCMAVPPEIPAALEAAIYLLNGVMEELK